jgi:hypothetical protein
VALCAGIPSDYALRSHTHNCFWGAKDDLDRVITREGPDFEKIQRGVFWCRASDSTEYDPVHDKFVSEQGTQDQWAASMKAMGAKNVVVASKKIGSIPSVRVTARMNGQRVYMLYLAVPGADSPAILINYHPAGEATRLTMRRGSTSSIRSRWRRSRAPQKPKSNRSSREAAKKWFVILSEAKDLITQMSRCRSFASLRMTNYFLIASQDVQPISG